MKKVLVLYSLLLICNFNLFADKENIAVNRQRVDTRGFIDMPEASIDTQTDIVSVSFDDSGMYTLLELAEKEKNRHHFELRTDIPSREGYLSKEEKQKSFYARSSCSGNMSSFMILPDGNVTYCEETYFNPNLMLGNILESSIMDVWSSERARNLFYLPKSIFPNDSPCSSCKEFEDCRYSKGICWVDVMAAY